MKSMKKLVLAGLILLASVMVLVGCDTQLEPEPEQTTVNEHVQEKPNTEQSGGSEQPSGTSGENDSVPEVPKYTVKFAKGNNTEDVSDLPVDLTVESGTVLTAEQLKPLTNTKTYVFVGWYDGETKAVAGNYTVTENVTLTAQWESVIIEKPNTEQSGGSGQPSGTSGENDSVPKYTVTFAKGNNTDEVSDLPSNLMVESGTVLTAEQLKPLTNTKNYVFVGWYDGETKAVAGTYTVTENVTLTAQWESIIVNVTEANFTESLTKAMANPGIILILESDIIVSETIKIESGNVTIDLNGKTLQKESGTVVNVADGATLTILDNGEGGKISGVNNGVENYGTVTVKDGIISGSGEGSIVVLNRDTGMLTVEGGEISGGRRGVENHGTVTVKDGIISGSGAGSIGVFNLETGILTVEGGEISEVDCGVENYGTVTVKAGIISGSGEGSKGVYNLATGMLTVEGGEISGGHCGVDNYGTVTVKDGIILGSRENSLGVLNRDTGMLTVEGGVISGPYYGVENYGTLTVEGGVISGVYYGVDNYGTLYLSGAPEITSVIDIYSFYLENQNPITLVGALTGTAPYSVCWSADPASGSKIVVGGEQVTLTADIAQKFTFTDGLGKDVNVELDSQENALVVKN